MNILGVYAAIRSDMESTGRRAASGHDGSKRMYETDKAQVFQEAKTWAFLLFVFQNSKNNV